MAKTYNFHIYSEDMASESKDSSLEEYDKHRIQIANELGEGTLAELKEIFRDDSNVAIANEIEPPGERGGGGLGIFPLIDIFHIGLTVSIILVSKGALGFFDELGKGLAKKLLSILFNKRKPTKLFVESKEKRIEIIVPSNTDPDNIGEFEKFFDDFNSQKDGKCVYSPETKSFVYIEEYKNYKELRDKG